MKRPAEDSSFWEEKEKQKDIALEAALKKARSVSDDDDSDDDVLPRPNFDDFETQAMVAQTRRIMEERRAKDQAEEEAMANEMREIARVQKEAEAIELAVKQAEAETLARLRNDVEQITTGFFAPPILPGTVLVAADPPPDFFVHFSCT